MSKTKSNFRSRLVRAGIATGTVAAVVLAASAPAYAEAKLTLSAASGPSGGTNTITATTPTAVFTSATTPVVSFQTVGAAGTTLCSATYLNPVAITVGAASPFAQTAGNVVAPAANVRKISSTKLAITVPSTSLSGGGTGAGFNTTGLSLGTNQTSAKYNVCVYEGSTVAAPAANGNPAVVGSALLASGTYTIAAAPTVTAVSPNSGPALGGTSITVTGTGFTTGTTATIGGAALTNVVVAPNGNSFTGIVAPHAAATDLPIVITSTGGRVTSALTVGAGGVDFTYSNGINVTPNTAPPGTTVDIDVQGVGFLGLTFTAGAVSSSTDAHVFLVHGQYNNAADANTAANRANPPIAECGNVLLINDTELVCSVDLTGSLTAAGAAVATAVPVGAYTVTVVSSGATAPAANTNFVQTDVTSGATFTVAPY